MSADGTVVPPTTGPKTRKKKEPFREDEDAKLRRLVDEKGFVWQDIAEQMPGRTPRQCRERWNLYLSPSVRNDPWSQEEELRLIRIWQLVGNRWTYIAKTFPNRTANNVKNKLKQCTRRFQKQAKTAHKRRAEGLPDGPYGYPMAGMPMPPSDPVGIHPVTPTQQNTQPA